MRIATSSICRVAIVVFAALAVHGAFAAADAPPPEAMAQAQSHFKLGNEHYKMGSYEPAIEEFMAAWKLDPRPQFLFNLGQCHRALGNRETAIDFYRRFITAVPLGPASDQARSYIAALTRELKQGAATPKGTPAAVAPPVASPPPGEAPATRAPIAPKMAAPAAPAEPKLAPKVAAPAAPAEPKLAPKLAAPATPAETKLAPKLAAPATPAEPKLAPKVAAPAAPAEPKLAPKLAAPATPAEPKLAPKLAAPAAPAEAKLAPKVAAPLAAPLRHEPQQDEPLPGERASKSGLVRKWWVWTIAGAVVATGAAVGIAYAIPNNARPSPADLGSVRINF